MDMRCHLASKFREWLKFWWMDHWYKLFLIVTIPAGIWLWLAHTGLAMVLAPAGIIALLTYFAWQRWG